MELKFLGGSETVTGSNYIFTVENKSVLVDFGLFQEKHQDNSKFDFNPQELNFAIVTHAHIDHIGRIPLLTKYGFKGKIYCTKETKQLAELMLRDSAQIQLKTTEEENKKKLKAGLEPIEPLYNLDDVDNVLAYFYPIEFHKKIIEENISFEFFKSGHILGAASVKFDIIDEGVAKSICFSGDLGNSNNLLLDHPEYVTGTDYVIMESTYGNRVHQNIENRRNSLGDILLNIYKNNEFALIPSFSLGRTQNIVLELKTLIETEEYSELSNLEIFIDSPLALNATNIYENNKKNLKDTIKDKSNMFRLPNIHFLNDLKDTFSTIKSPNPKVVVSSSGMCSGGKILFYLAELINKESTNIIFIGYQAEDTLGRDILERKTPVSINKKKYEVKAKIHKIDGYSAHGDQNDLVDWVTHDNNSPDIIFITHGEENSRKILKEKISEKIKTNIILPKTNQVFKL